MVFKIEQASEKHLQYAETICNEMEASAKVRGTGIAKRSPEYLEKKMLQGNAIIALTEKGDWAGFCYIETWSHEKFVANSGLIVSPNTVSLVWQKKSNKLFLIFQEPNILILKSLV